MEVRRLPSGTLAYVGERGVCEIMRCTWLIEVASGNPEPDCYADTIKIVECGEKVKGDPDGVTECEAGHRRAPYGSPEAEYDLMMAEIDGLTYGGMR